MERFEPISTSPPTRAHISGLVIREVNRHEIQDIQVLNMTIFNEERIINTFKREDLLILEARMNGVPVGFKVGYRENRFTFYSAKGGVLAGYRRRGIALALMYEMMRIVEKKGYRHFAFDTFPNLHAGMTILALQQGFHLVKSDFNSVYKEYRLRFEKRLDQAATP